MKKLIFIFYKIKAKLLIPRILFHFLVFGVLMLIYGPFKLVEIMLRFLISIILDKTSPNDFFGINERNYKNKIVKLFAKSEGWVSVGEYSFKEEEC